MIVFSGSQVFRLLSSRVSPLSLERGSLGVLSIEVNSSGKQKHGPVSRSVKGEEMTNPGGISEVEKSF